MKKRKVAVFVHGWSAKGKQWKHRNHKLLSLFKEYDYETVLFDLSGEHKYMDPDKGFEYYAQLIATLIEKTYASSSCPCCDRHWPIDEIVLVAHSMGGVASRLYLQDNTIGDLTIKQKVTKLITLASPHHGTSVLIEDFFEPLLTVLAGSSFSNLESFHNSRCYNELLPGSEFIREFNLSSPPSHIAFHSIWARGDKVVTPTHTAVSDFAHNHFIDNLGIGHIGVMHSIFTRDIVQTILDGKIEINGLQKYPPKCDCQEKIKQWIPVFYYSERKDNGLFSLEKEWEWRCRNVFVDNEGIEHRCDEVHVQKFVPGLIGCKVGLMKERFHVWTLTGIKHWHCAKCGKSAERKKHPKEHDINNCVRPFKNWHRWRLDWRQWRCKECSAVRNEIFMPPLLGCPTGIIHDKKLHDWHRVKKVYAFKFKCSGCAKVVTIKS